jgi:hypothetical protein
MALTLKEQMLMARLQSEYQFGYNVRFNYDAINVKWSIEDLELIFYALSALFTVNRLPGGS